MCGEVSGDELLFRTKETKRRAGAGGGGGGAGRGGGGEAAAMPCVDVQSEAWCEKKRAKGKCLPHLAGLAACRLTCGKCGARLRAAGAA